MPLELVALEGIAHGLAGTTRALGVVSLLRQRRARHALRRAEPRGRRPRSEACTCVGERRTHGRLEAAEEDGRRTVRCVAVGLVSKLRPVTKWGLVHLCGVAVVGGGGGGAWRLVLAAVHGGGAEVGGGKGGVAT